MLLQYANFPTVGQIKHISYLWSKPSTEGPAVCFGSLSCWNVSLWPSLKSFCNRFSSRIELYWAPSTSLSTLTSFPDPAEENHPTSRYRNNYVPWWGCCALTDVQCQVSSTCIVLDMFCSLVVSDQSTFFHVCRVSHMGYKQNFLCPSTMVSLKYSHNHVLNDDQEIILQIYLCQRVIPAK